MQVWSEAWAGPLVSLVRLSPVRHSNRKRPYMIGEKPHWPVCHKSGEQLFASVPTASVLPAYCQPPAASAKRLISAGPPPVFFISWAAAHHLRPFFFLPHRHRAFFFFFYVLFIYHPDLETLVNRLTPRGLFLIATRCCFQPCCVRRNTTRTRHHRPNPVAAWRLICAPQTNADIGLATSPRSPQRHSSSALSCSLALAPSSIS